MSRRRTWTVVSAVTAGTMLFAAAQNAGARGGPIGLPKMLWLNLAVLSFVALPALAARDQTLPKAMRGLFAFLAASFALRGAVELPVLYLTTGWHCGYGIAHDLATAGAVAGLWSKWRRSLPRATQHAQALLGLSVALCLVEAGFAGAFCAVADPATTWFASGEPRYAAINGSTWAVVVVAYPTLGALLWRLTTPSPGSAVGAVAEERQIRR